MGLLDSFEKGLERAVNSAFAKSFRSGIQPVEIAAALRSELDAKASVVSRDRILVPNSFEVRLAPADTARLGELGETLSRELHTLVSDHATAQGFNFAGPLSIQIVSSDQVSPGTLRVSSRTSADVVAWRGVLEIDGRPRPLVGTRTTIGRGADADITIADAGSSRRHAEILWDGERALVRDLGSTNGTRLNGTRVTEAPLLPDSVITIGSTHITFRVTPEAVGQSSATRGVVPRE